MGNTFIIIGVVILVLAIALLVLWILSGKNAKKNYRPPVASQKTVLPDHPAKTFPYSSGKEIRFCLKCGAANSDRAAFCSKCGAKL